MTFGAGSLSATDRTDTTTLYIGQAQLFHFILTAGAGDPGATVRVVIRDESGAEVHRLAARSGASDSGSSVVLVPGTYSVLYEIDNPNGPALSYSLSGAALSNPMGPVKGDATLAPKHQLPQVPNPTNPPYYGYPPGSISYDPSTLSGYVNPQDPSTYPPDVLLPPEYLGYPWFVAVTDPFYWLQLNQ